RDQHEAHARIDCNPCASRQTGINQPRRRDRWNVHTLARFWTSVTARAAEVAPATARANSGRKPPTARKHGTARRQATARKPPTAEAVGPDEIAQTKKSDHGSTHHSGLAGDRLAAHFARAPRRRGEVGRRAGPDNRGARREKNGPPAP